MQWQHEREVYGASPRVCTYVLRNQLYSREPGANGSGANRIVQAAVSICNELYKYVWPGASLPSMRIADDYALPSSIVERLGQLDKTFGGCDKMRVFMPLFNEIPDLYPLSRSSVVGSLRGTVQYEEETANKMEFRSRLLRKADEWVEMLKANSSNMDTTLAQEINLFVSVGVWAMRRLYCEDTFIPRESIPLDVTNTFAVSAARTRSSRNTPSWMATHGKFLNGVEWVRAFSFEVLKLTSMRTALCPGVPDIVELPTQELVWDEYHCCLEPDSLAFHRFDNGIDHYYVPRFDLTDFPVEIKNIFRDWAGGSPTSVEVPMKPVEWYTLCLDENTTNRPTLSTDVRCYAPVTAGKDTAKA